MQHVLMKVSDNMMQILDGYRGTNILWTFVVGLAGMDLPFFASGKGL